MNWLVKIADQPSGECFKLAAKWGMDNYADVIHGTINMAQVGGRRPHAWNEKDGKVFDPTLDHWFSVEKWYSPDWITQAQGETRYNGEEAVVKAIQEGHWGPW